MRFLVDAQLPPALARALTAAGHIAEHVTDIGPGDASDSDLWRTAVDNAAILVTKDADFVDLSALEDHGPFVVWVRFGNTRRAELIARFMPCLDAIAESVEAGDRLVELR